MTSFYLKHIINTKLVLMCLGCLIVGFGALAQTTIINVESGATSTPPNPPPILQDAQSASQRGENLNVLYRNEANFSILAHTNGLGFNYRRCKHITGTKKGIVEFELVNMRHPKEVKVKNQSYPNSKGFYYGKLNSFIVFRPGVGYQKTLFRKAERKSVEIRLGTFAGASLGFAKPIYLEIIQPPLIPGTFKTNEERYSPQEHYPDNIFARAPFLRGIEETKIYPGGYGKIALSVEYSDHNEDVKAIEMGMVVDIYPKVVPIMALSRNNQVFVNFYVSFVFGRKWF